MGGRNKISVVLATDEFTRFAEFCKAKGYKKSTLIARLIREHVDSEGFMVQRSLPLPMPQAPAAVAGPVHSKKRRT